jgi:hypothetical protein
MTVRGTNELILDLTHGMLKNGCQVGFFVTSHFSGANCVLGVFVCAHVAHDDMEWTLNGFKNFFTHSPNVIMTDQDVAFPAAIQIAFPDSPHHYCIFHKMLNFVGNLRCYFVTSDPDTWNEVMKVWWRLGLDTDEQLRATVKEKWDFVVGKVQDRIRVSNE